MNDTIKTRVDFDHAHQLLTAKIESAMDTVKAFAKEKGLQVGLIVSFEVPVPKAAATPDAKGLELVHGFISNMNNVEANMLEACLRMCKHVMIDEPQENGGIVASLKKAAEVGKRTDLEMMRKLAILMKTATELEPILTAFSESGDSESMSRIVKEAMSKMTREEMH